MGAGKSTFTFSNQNITIDGGSTTISIARDNQSYSHKLLHGYGEIATLAVGTTSYTYKPTASALTKFFEEAPAQKSRLIDVYLDTYNGSTKVGRDVHALTVTLSEVTGKPSISGFAITDSNTTAKSWGIIVYGKSNLTATATPAGKYGATISRTIFTCDYNNKHYESYDVNDLIASLPLTNTPANFTLGYKSTDSRGFSNTVTLSKSIAAYQAPHVDTFEVIRCDSSGNESDTGTKAKVVINGSWTAMKVGTAYKNPATLKVGYKTKTDTSYTYQTFTVSAGTVNVSQLLSATLDANTDYEFSVQLTDSFETYSETGVGCSNVKNILYVSADGNEMVIGTDAGNNVAIDSDGLNIRNGSSILASFKSNRITIGNDSITSNISLCNGAGNINGIIGETRDGLQLGSGFLHFDAYNAHIIMDNSIGFETWIGNPVSGHMSYVTENLNDWVAVQDVSGPWFYRKWASGVAECFGSYQTSSFNIETPLGTGALYYSDQIASLAFPFTFISVDVEIPWITVTGAVTGSIFSTWTMADSVNTPSRSRAYRVVRSGILKGVVASVHYYVKGRWK